MTRAGRVGSAVVAALVAVFAGLAAWAFVFEPASLRTTVYPLALPDWPAECAGLRVAILGDLHVGSPFQGLAKLERVVQATNAARPDLILLPGDFVIGDVPGGELIDAEPIAAALAGLRASAGIFAVLGNHDWWYSGTRVRRSLENAGIPVLENVAREVTAGQCRLWIAGIGDVWEHMNDVHAALASVPPGVPLIAFTHNPDIFPEIPARVSLTVAAHTHGGQVYLPLIGRPIVPSKYGERFAIGHIVENGRHLFVHSGIGTSILPVRFLVPPEIAVLELNGKTARLP